MRILNPASSSPSSSLTPVFSWFAPEHFPFWLILSFLLGLLWGSFFNVCIYRLPMGLSPNRPRRSFCFSCGMGIAWYDNIPLISWIMLRGRCRHCGARISARYLIIELLTGLIFALLWWKTNSPEQTAARGFSASVLWNWTVAGMLIVGAMTDIDHWIIPDGITRGGFWAALAAALVLPWIDPHAPIIRSGPFPTLRHVEWSDPIEVIEAVMGRTPERLTASGRIVGNRSRVDSPPEQSSGQSSSRQTPPRIIFRWWEPFANALLGGVVGYGMLWMVAFVGRIFFRREAMGGGDLKLFGFLGAVFGPFLVLVLLFLSSLAGVIIGVGAMLWSSIRPPRRVRISDLLPVTEECPSTVNATTPPTVQQTQDGAVRESEASVAPSSPPGAQPPESSPRTPQQERRRILEEYLIYARKRPLERSFHHIPFGPSISLAALFLLAYSEPLREILLAYLLPVF